MKVCQDLTIGPFKQPTEVEDFIARIESQLSHGWSRKQEEGATNRPYFFACSEPGGRSRDAKVFVRRENLTLSVGADVTPFSYDEHNAILCDFYTRFVRPVAREMKIKLKLSKPDQCVDDWMSNRVARLFKLFTARRSDQSRRFDFLIAVQRQSSRRSPPKEELLHRWLMEEEHLPQVLVSALIEEYQFALKLLTYAQNFRYPRRL